MLDAHFVYAFVRQEIIELKRCHEENPVAKFWGVCNQTKYELDECFKAEKIVKRSAQFGVQRLQIQSLLLRCASHGVSARNPA